MTRKRSSRATSTGPSRETPTEDAPRAVSTLKHDAPWRRLALVTMQSHSPDSGFPSTFGQLRKLLGWTSQAEYWKRRTGRLSLEEAVKMGLSLGLGGDRLSNWLIALAKEQGMALEPGKDPNPPGRRQPQRWRCTQCGGAGHYAKNCPKGVISPAAEHLLKMAKMRPKFRGYPRPPVTAKARGE